MSGGGDARDGGPDLRTLAVHAGADADPETGAVTPPIHPSTTFLQEPDGSARAGYVYARTGNPTRTRLEEAVAALHPAAGLHAAAAAFASGSAAASALLRSVDPGGVAIVPDDMYHGIRRLLLAQAERWGVTLRFVDTSDLAAVGAALAAGDVALVWLETPSNPSLKVSDVAGAVDLAHRAGARLAVDATWTPPGVADPFREGADVVMHSSTKYLAGHSDVLGGVVVARSEDDPTFAFARSLQGLEGAVPSPFDAWLTLRGLRTLALRVRAASDTAETLATFLAGHPAVHAVAYPGRSDHPNHAVAAAQMDRFGAMLSFRVRGGADAARRVAAATRWFRPATSLGGVESLIEHRAPVEGPDTPTPEDLLRVSVGIEAADDLVRDLAAALATLEDA
ncbi:MAG: PLP-dependent transferase [Trueperaceae bacterium]|nr:PLP-dependent transferase [Trueperaceae bacterium]